MRRAITRRAITLTITIAALLVVGAAVASAGGGGYGGCDAFASGDELRMHDSCFDATAQFVAAGTELRVSNEGSVGHTITAADGSFDSGIIDPGGTFELELDEPGIVRIYCRPHGSADGFGMAGVLVVGEPTPQADGAEEIAASLRRALEAQSGEVQEAVRDQSSRIGSVRASVSSLSRDVRELRATIDADTDGEDVRVLGAGDRAASRDVLPGLIGLLIGGGLVAAALRRRRPTVETGDEMNDEVAAR